MQKVTKVGRKPKDRFFLLKRIIGLMAQLAPWRQYQLEIGVYLLKKGTRFKVGQIIDEKKINENTYQVKVITGLFYDFNQNKVNHTVEKRIMKV